MSFEGSVTHWIRALKDGDPDAAQPLWERYYRQLVSLARKKLPPDRRRAVDEEDVVQNAFHSFFRGVERGGFPQLNDRDDLGRLLVLITARKALDQVAHDRSKKQGGGTVQGESGLHSGGESEAAAIEQVVGEEPSPEFAAQVAEQCRHLLDLLADDGLRRVAVCKMEGFTRDEIAAKLGCSRRTVARKLDTIRIIWSEEVP